MAQPGFFQGGESRKKIYICSIFLLCPEYNIHYKYNALVDKYNYIIYIFKFIFTM